MIPSAVYQQIGIDVTRIDEVPGRYSPRVANRWWIVTVAIMSGSMPGHVSTCVMMCTLRASQVSVTWT
jgi:hypothetical protein